MIKGASGKQTVETKGMIAHGFIGDVPQPKQMKGQNDKKTFSADSVSRKMSMNKSKLKGQC